MSYAGGQELELEDDEPGTPDPGLEDEADGEPDLAHLAGKGVAWSRRTYDWPAIRARYVEGVVDPDDDTHGRILWPSLKEVAEHFGAADQRVREKSAAEGWVEQRAKWQQQIERDRQEQRSKHLAKEAGDLDASALKAGKFGVTLVVARLAEIAEAQKARAGLPAVEKAYSTVIEARELEALGKAADLFHRIGLRAVGDPETQRMEITGANGQPLDLGSALRRDDPNRIAGVLSILAQAGIAGILDDEDEPLDVEGRELGDPPALEAGR